MGDRVGHLMIAHISPSPSRRASGEPKMRTTFERSVALAAALSLVVPPPSFAQTTAAPVEAVGEATVCRLRTACR